MSEKHLAFIRSLACLVHHCTTESQAHHVRSAGTAGTGMKPDDRWAVPLCEKHHTEGHQRGWKTFEKMYGLDLAKEAEFLWSVSCQPMP